MQPLFVLAFCIALASSVCTHTYYSHLTSQCCTPRQWEGEATGWDAKRNTSFFETISYDYENHRLRVDAFTHHDRQFHMWTVFEEISRHDGKNRLYFVESGKCTVQVRDYPMKEACVRTNHHERRHLTIGGSLSAIWHGYTTPTIQESVIVAEHTCLPIEGIFFEHHGRQYQMDVKVSYFNIRGGIGNPIIFEIPSICPK